MNSNFSFQLRWKQVQMVDIFPPRTELQHFNQVTADSHLQYVDFLSALQPSPGV